MAGPYLWCTRACASSYVHESLLAIDLIPLQVDECGYVQAMLIGEQEHGVFAVPISFHAPRSPGQSFNFRCSEVYARADVHVLRALGKHEFRHKQILAEEDSCFRWSGAVSASPA